MMKTKVAMAISLAGVLAAGTAAALVNTHVLNGGASSPLGAVAPATQQSTPADPLSSAAEAPVVTASAGPAAASTTQATYAIGDSGTVTLDTAGDRLAIVGVAPAAGWIVTQSETGDGSNVDVKFQTGNVEVEFNANLLYGVVRTSVESHDLSTTNNSVGGIGGGDDSESGFDDSGGGEDNGGNGGGGDD